MSKSGVKTHEAKLSGGRLKLAAACVRQDGRVYTGFVLKYKHKIESDKMEFFVPVIPAGNDDPAILRATIDLRDIPLRQTNWAVFVRAGEGGAIVDLPMPYPRLRKRAKLFDFLRGGETLGAHILFTYASGGNLGLRYRKRGRYDGLGVRLRELTALVVYKLRRHAITRERAMLIYEKKHQKAQDNAWYLFKYCMEHDMERVLGRRIYYVIERGAPDRAKMAAWRGNVLDFMSLKFMTRALGCALLASAESRLHDYVWHPCRSLVAPRLAKKPHLFLQHGVLAFKRLNNSYLARNLKSALVTCIARDEANIMRDALGFSEDQIAITGYARFDALEDRSESCREMMLMPTHRNWLFGVEADVFTASEYFTKYMELLNAPALGDFLEENDLQLNFMIHPSISEQSHLFTSQLGRVRIVRPGEESIDSLMMRAKALVTDYSSIAWDMYYMDKPSIFYQFDAEAYDETWGSYIDLKTEMPGDRAETLDELLGCVRACAENGFAVAPKYEGLRRRYFKYLDKDNCKRICEEIAYRGL